MDQGIKKEQSHKDPSDLRKINPFDFFSEILRENSDQTIHLIIEFTGSVDSERIKKAVTRAIYAEPVCYSQLVENDNMLWWRPGTRESSQICFQQIESKDLLPVLRDILSTTIDPFHDPLFQAILICSRNAGDVLVLHACHVAMDGRGLKDMASLIMDLYLNLETNPSFQISDTSWEERNLPPLSSIVPDPLVPFIAGPNSHRWIFPISSQEQCQKKYALMSLSPDQMRIIHQKRKEWGGTINDLLLASLAIVCAQLTPDRSVETISFMNTVDLRRYISGRDRSVTNYSTAYEVKIPITKTGTLPVLCKTVHDLMMQKKSSSLGYHEACEAEMFWNAGLCEARTLYSLHIEDAHYPETRIPIVTNTGIIKFNKFVYSHPEITRAYLLPCHAKPPVLFFSISTFQDQLTVTSTYYSPAISEEQVRFIFQELFFLLLTDTDRKNQPDVQII